MSPKSAEEACAERQDSSVTDLDFVIELADDLGQVHSLSRFWF